MKVIRIALTEKFSKIMLSFFKKFKGMFKLILLILLFGFIYISPKTRYLVGISLKQIASFLLWTVKYEDREIWMIDNPSWIPN